jgi:membrane peptidoglycan carboxypeptidase
MRRPSQLQPNEAAFLAAILPSPLRFYKAQYLKEKAQETRIDWILNNMGDAGKLTPQAVRTWTQAPLRFVPPPAAPQD